jgi:hypothetical protein
MERAVSSRFRSYGEGDCGAALDEASALSRWGSTRLHNDILTPDRPPWPSKWSRRRCPSRLR